MGGMHIDNLVLDDRKNVSKIVDGLEDVDHSVLPLDHIVQELDGRDEIVMIQRLVQDDRVDGFNTFISTNVLAIRFLFSNNEQKR